MWDILLTLGVRTLVSLQPSPLTLLQESPSAAPILQVRLKPFIRVLMFSPFTFLLFLLVFGLHLITHSCSLGVHPPPHKGVGDRVNYQCPTWMEPIILRLFLVGLVHRGTSNGLVGSFVHLDIIVINEGWQLLTNRGSPPCRLIGLSVCCGLCIGHLSRLKGFYKSSSMRQVHVAYPFKFIRRTFMHQTLILFASPVYLSRVEDRRDLAHCPVPMLIFGWRLGYFCHQCKSFLSR